MKHSFSSSLALLVVLLGAAGCDSAYSYSGLTIWTFFPLDGDRSWEYAAFSNAEDRLIIEKGSTSRQGKVDIVTLEHYTMLSDGNPGDLLLEVNWSSDVNNGALLHGYTDIAGGSDPVVFDPPVQFMKKQGDVGDVFETQSGGAAWSSTFVELTGCGTIFDPDWDEEECVHMKLDDGDADLTTHAPVTGDYWLIPRYQVAWFETDYYGVRYNLTMADWAAN